MPKALKLSRAASAVRASVFAELQKRIDAFTARGGKLVPLQIGDTHVAPPPAALLSAVSDVEPFDAELYRYGPIGGLAALRERAATHLAATGLAGVDPGSELLIGCGATHALFCAAKVLLEPGDEVILLSPFWPLAPGVLRVCGAVPVEVAVPSRAAESPSLGAQIEAALTPRTVAIYLITPNNPSGRVLSQEDLEAIAKVAQRRDLWVFADEVYADFAYERPHVSIASLPGMRDRTITARSFSKSHALAGARVGFIAGAAEVIAAAMRVSTHTVYNVPLVSQRAAVAALDAGPAWLDGARREYLAARDQTIADLEGSGARFEQAEGGAYLFLDFAEVLGGRPLKVLLERAIDEGVLLAPGDAFGEGFETHARLCYTGVPRGALHEGVMRLRAAIDALG